LAGIDGNSSVEVSLPWRCGITSWGAFEGGGLEGGGFDNPCCSCAAAGATSPMMIARAISAIANEARSIF